MRPILENASEGDVFEIHLSPSVENCTMENPLVIRYTVSSAQVSTTEELASGEVVAIAGGLLLVSWHWSFNQFIPFNGWFKRRIL